MAIDIKKGMNDLPEEMAKRFYEVHERLIFQRMNFSKTSLTPNLWKDLRERDRREYVEAFRELLSDQIIMGIIRNRSEIGGSGEKG